MKEKRLHEKGGIAMKQYFITVNYTQSGLCAMERDMLDQAKPFNSCIVIEPHVDKIVAYFESLQQAFHTAKPKLKTVDIYHWAAGNGVSYIHIGQICLRLTEVSDMPMAFYNYLINRNNE